MFPLANSGMQSAEITIGVYVAGIGYEWLLRLEVEYYSKYGIVTLTGFTANFGNYQPTAFCNFNGLASPVITIMGTFSVNVTIPSQGLFTANSSERYF